MVFGRFDYHELDQFRDNEGRERYERDGLTPSDITFLLGIREDRCPVVLDLSRWEESHDFSIEYVLRALQSNTNVKCLDLSSNNLLCYGELYRMLLYNKGLERINFSNNKFEYDTATVVVEGILDHQPDFKTLDLSGNDDGLVYSNYDPEDDIMEAFPDIDCTVMRTMDWGMQVKQTLHESWVQERLDREMQLGRRGKPTKEGSIQPSSPANKMERYRKPNTHGLCG